MASATSTTFSSFDIEKAVASQLWPQHAEMLSSGDWTVLSNAVHQNRSLSESSVEPVGESKDAILASLLILYWTMKIVYMGIQIAKELSHLPQPQRKEALVRALRSKIDSDTPKIVADRIGEIVECLKEK
jgi:hypothetical protein